MTQTVNPAPNIFHWRKPKPTPEEEAAATLLKEKQRAANQRALERARKLTAACRVPGQEGFNEDRRRYNK